MKNEADPQKVFVFTSYGIDDVNDIHLKFAEKCGYSVMTCEEKVFMLCGEKNINAVLLPDSPRKFKKALKKIDISLLILAGDSYYGMHNYLARHYKSVFIQGISFNSIYYWEKTAARKENYFYLWLYKLLGLTGVLFGKHRIIYGESLKEVICALIEKINWDLKPGLLLHGRFCDMIFLQTEWEREIWLKNGFPRDKIRVTGAIQADWIVDNLLEPASGLSKEGVSSDLLFFSQPLYQYAGEPRYLEELEMLVNECSKMRLKLVIKLHPRDDVNIYSRFESDNCRIIIHDINWKDADNVALIRGAKVVIGKGSTSMLLALLLQKPVMYLDLFDSDVVHFKYFVKPKLLLSRIEDFMEMYSYAANPENRAFIEHHQKEILSNFGSWDGQCWKRIKSDITQFLEKTETPANLQGA